MRPLIRIAFALFFLCLAFIEASAGTRSVSPVHPHSLQIHFRQIRKLDSFLTVRAAPVYDGTKPANGNLSVKQICSCQILNLQSSNYNHRQVALLAEKTNDGSSTVYEVARERLQKEKKLLKNMFYDKVELVGEMQGSGSCKSMFSQLRMNNKNLQLYEILDADIRQVQ